MKKKVVKPFLAALLAFSMAFSGAGVSALAVEMNPAGTEQGSGEGNNEENGITTEEPEAAEKIELTE